ncbi:MAG: ureidoglycolate lyase [Candidatus Rokubacteria bacterium]|nr:ureidoglycolate lyase [Candidatus Rokubacteria bacterium]
MPTPATERIQEIPVEPLTETAFAPFGRIIGPSRTPPIFQTEGLASWRVDFEVIGPVEVMFARYRHQPMVFALMERHFNVTQSFIPLGHAPTVMVVAPPTDPRDWSAIPRPEAVRAFFLDGACGVMLWKGTWHALNRFPVRPAGADFALLTGAETQRELEAQSATGGQTALTQTVDYRKPFGTSFKVVDPSRLLS